MGKFIDLTGQRFGKLTVLERVYPPNRKSAYWKCLCDCGNEKVVKGGNLTSGNISSCGCLLRKYQTRSEIYHDRIHKIYHAMKRRCLNPKDHKYEYYGGRGIGVCQEWLDDYLSFRKWAINNGYKSDLTLDRIDTEKGYSPENCRWATIKEQCNNRRSNHLITYNGKTQSMTMWAEELGVTFGTLKYRISHNRDIEQVFAELKQ